MAEPPLKGIRILDFTWVLAGPYATRLLASYGAEVIKVQPLFPEPDDLFSRGYYETWNKNKLGITLNLDTKEGLDIARRLIALSDVVIENFSPRVMENWGLDYPTLDQIRPNIIFLRMSLAGHSGPFKNYIGFGPTVEAISGLTSLISYTPGPPLGMGFSISDHISGLYAAVALLGALEFRFSTGKGQYIDLSQVEATSSLLADNFLDAQSSSSILPDESAPEGIYPCLGEDRWAAITVSGQAQWDKFKKALEQPDWAARPEFSSVSARIQNKELLDNYIRTWTSLRPPEEVMTVLQESGISAGVVQNAADLAAYSQLQCQDFYFKTINKTAPTKGEDNDYVYRELLEFSQEDLERLKWEGII